MPEIILEACVETLEEAILAEKSGAHRIELCADLEVGGTTPSPELIMECLQNLTIPIMAMIRTRGGDFTCSDQEFLQMKSAIDFCKSVGVQGVVFGILDENGEIDLKRTADLADYASPLQVTFHKAIDTLSNPVEAVIKLKNTGKIHRILTSGGAATAMEGQIVLRKMVAIAGSRMQIIAGGKVTKDNWKLIQELTGVSELHGKRIVF